MTLRPAYITIAAAVLGVGGAVLGIADLVDDVDAALTVGLAVVLAVIGLKER